MENEQIAIEIYDELVSSYHTDVVGRDTVVVQNIEEHLDAWDTDFRFSIGDSEYRVIKDSYIDDIYNKQIKENFYEDNPEFPSWIVIDWEQSLKWHYVNCRYVEFFGVSQEHRVEEFHIFPQ